MTFIEFIKSRLGAKRGKQYASSPTSWLPIFSMNGNTEYDSVVVQQAINCIVKEMKKLYPQHVVRSKEGDIEPQMDSIQRVLERPNPLMSTSDFVEKIVWNLMLNYNSFVLPVWDESNNLTALYPIQPSSVDFLQDASGRYFVTFHFPNLYEGTVPYDDVIHIRYNYSVNEFMGGNEFGQPDNSVLNKTLEVNSVLLDGVAKALKSSFQINGLLKINTIIDEQKAKEEVDRITRALNANESGIMTIDLKSQFEQFKKDIKMVDADTLKFIDEKILRHFRVPLCILEGDYTTEQYEAFYQSTLEPMIISMGQAFTNCLFSDHQKFGYGHRIIFQPKELIFLSTQQKLEALRLLGDAGGLYVNEARQLIGFPAKPEFNGVKFQSLNYIQGSGDSEGNIGNNEEGEVQ